MGTQIRTTNEIERDAATAQIGAHWRRFYENSLADRIPDRLNAAVHFGVYTGYESDHRGAYSHVIACEVGRGSSAVPGMTVVTIPTSQYLVFSADGELPGVVIRTWGAVWQYFERETKAQRAYTADFERYDRQHPSRVEIFVAVK